MRLFVRGLIVIGVLAIAPRIAGAQTCQNFNLAELVTLTGTFDNTDCVAQPYRNSRGEYWNVFANVGEVVTITMNRVTMQDPYLYLLNPSGVIVATNDDAAPGSLNARIQYTAAVTGTYQVLATSFVLQPSNDFGTYEIRLEISGHSPCQIRDLPAGVTTNATLDATDCIVQPYRGARGEIWTITATAGNTIQLNMNRFTLQDPYLFLLNSNWQILASNDDFGGVRDSQITFVATYTGTYRVIATTFAATDPGAYSIRLEGGATPPPPPATGAPGPPGQPVIVVSGNQVNISWTPPTTGGTPILEYILDVGSFAGGTNFGSYSIGTQTSVVAAVANGTYFLRVRARNATGSSTASAEASFTVGIISFLQPPRNLSVTVAGRRVTLQWLAPLDGPPDTYRLEAGTAPGLANLLVTDLAAVPTAISFDNVPPGAYYVRLRAVRGGAVSAPSNEIVILVL